MGYAIYLCDPNNMDVPVYVKPFTGGSNIQVCPLSGKELQRTLASITITYNYSVYYYKTIDETEGIRWLYGKEASETIERLQKAIETLGTKRSSNYWESTSGNAGYMLSILLDWAEQFPDAIWDGD